MIFKSVYKIKKGKRKQWEAWCKEIMIRYNEAVSTMAEENLISERCVIFGEGDNSFVMFIHETEDNKAKIPMNKQKPINQKHQQMWDECIEVINWKKGYEVKR